MSITVNASADTIKISTEELVSYSKKDLLFMGFYLGYLSAAANTAIAENKVCLPEDVNLPEIRPILPKYLAANKEIGKTSAHESVVAALAEKWPCKK